MSNMENLMKISWGDSVKIPLSLRKTIGIISRLYYPTFGTCGHCGRAWAVAKRHLTRCNDQGGCFTLCQMCWEDLTIEQRLPHYLSLYLQWRSEGFATKNGVPWEQVWKEMESAVRAGL